MVSYGAMDTNIERTVAAQTGDAYVDGLLEQLAAAERRDEQAEQARQAVKQTRQITEQDLRLADLKIQKLTLELAYYKRLHYAAKSEHYHGEQLELFEQDMAADLAAIEAGQESLPSIVAQPRRVAAAAAGVAAHRMSP